MRLSRLFSAPFLAGLALGIVGTVGAATTLGSDVFTDVEEGSYYDSAVGEMYDLGIVKGSGGMYRPGDYVNRAEIAVMLKRLRDEMTGNVDVSSSSRSRSTSSSSSSSSSSTSSSSSSLNPKGTLRFTTSELRVPENVSTDKITVAVVRTGGNEGSVTVEYSMAGGTASEGSDYTKASGTLTFANKETSKTFDIAIKDDSNSEGNETVTITLSNPGNGVSLGTPSTATLIITDDEAGSSTSSSSSSSSSSMGPNVGFGATNYSVNENGATLTVTVVRGGSSSSTATVNYSTANGSGKSGGEYAATSGTLTFAAGETSKTFTVGIFDDNSDDGAKTFTLSLTSPQGAVLTPNLGSATVTINDNETVEFGSGSFKFSKSGYAVSENGGNAVVTVQRTGSTTNVASVTYSTATITASGGSDFTHVSGTLNFAVNESAKIILIPITKDTVADTGETFSVDLLNPSSNMTLITPYNATVTIE